jgi:hypothetical protein
MYEIYEFRIVGEHARRLFADNEGQNLGNGFVRKVVLRAEDPRVAHVAALQAELIEKGDAFFLGWHIDRRYTKSELLSAELLYAIVTRMFEPTGEECGTVYDDTAACSVCGAGAERRSPLVLDGKAIPKRDIARSLGNEVVVSARLADQFQREWVSGVRFDKVYQGGTIPLLALPGYREPVIGNAGIEIAGETRFGAELFENSTDPRYRCVNGDLLGLNLLSELFVKSATVGPDDVQATRQFVGVHRGLIRPYRCLLIGPKVRDLLLREKFTGFKLEVVHLV